ncbi:DUF4337 domain-containing protein [Brachyspira catarrhinii]|uniref:V-type ATP synthase subunit E n=1 Tax=Brachyspira catarrhinii TaxID=2528966 RepID=A0ABY2TTS3_9SPIR|nr:DUF4337 domain-containing protein [Brachyspira catarrhinii]TKZ36151.1 hypothetical protein EZH24_01605 [Brachyspira catarrhinii]
MVDIIKELNSRAINENYKKELTENVQNIFKLGVISPTLIDILNKKNDALLEEIAKLKYKNKELKNKNEELEKQLILYREIFSCKYPINIVAYIIKKNYHLDLSEETILDISQKNNMFDDDRFALAIPLRNNELSVIYSPIGVVKIIIYSKKLIEDKISSLIKESDREPMSIGKRIKEIEKEVSKNGDYIFSTSGKK